MNKQEVLFTCANPAGPLINCLELHGQIVDSVLILDIHNAK